MTNKNQKSKTTARSKKSTKSMAKKQNSED